MSSYFEKTPRHKKKASNQGKFSNPEATNDKNLASSNGTPLFFHSLNASTKKQGLIQRQITEEENEEQLKEGASIQTKLEIGRPDDKYENEADRVADHVMRMPDDQSLQGQDDDELIQTKPVRDKITPKVQRDTDIESLEEVENDETLQAKENQTKPEMSSKNLSRRIKSLNNEGQPLPESERAFFEPRFGADFSKVRIHDNAQAAETARSINAKAFTTKNNIVFNANQYAPKSEKGRTLLAHELTHVIQQNDKISPHRQKVDQKCVQPMIQKAKEDEVDYLKKQKGKKRRGVIAFIMGSDVGGFYDLANQYWKLKSHSDRIVDNINNFADIIAYLNNAKNKPLFNKPWGEINIIVHGSEFGAYMPVGSGSSRNTTYRALLSAINDETIKALPDTIVDEKTNINLHGCEIGKAGKLLKLISIAFGGQDKKAPKVFAPKLPIGYEQKSGRPVTEILEPEFWVVIPKKNPAKAIKTFKSKYSWLPARQKKKFKGKNITWDKVGYNDDMVRPVPVTIGITQFKVTFKEVQLPKAEQLRKHAKIIKKNTGDIYKKYFPPAKGKVSRQKNSFEVTMNKQKLLGERIKFEVKYIFFSRQQSGKQKWRNPEGNWSFKIIGDQKIPGGWQQRVRKWVGKSIYKGYNWKKISEQKTPVWYGREYMVKTQGTGFRATIQGSPIKKFSRKSKYYGRYKRP
jgi:hypothetical protein